MKRLTASILALGLAATVGTASAQSSGYYSQYGSPYGQSQYGSQYGQPVVDRYGQSNGAYYDYARVVRVDPVIDSGYGRTNSYPTSNGQRCYTRQDTYAGNDVYSNNGYQGNGYYGNQYGNQGYGYGNPQYGNQGYGTGTGRTVATVIGGVLGAALGSQVGGGSARYATSAIGSLVGGIAGQKVYETSQRNRYPRTGTVEVCDPVQVDGNGYSTSNGYSSYGQSRYGGYVNDSRVSGYDVTYEYGGRTYTTRTNYNPGSRIRIRVDVTPG